jgi:hypothetical protein
VRQVQRSQGVHAFVVEYGIAATVQPVDVARTRRRFNGAMCGVSLRFSRRFEWTPSRGARMNDTQPDVDEQFAALPVKVFERMYAAISRRMSASSVSLDSANGTSR